MNNNMDDGFQYLDYDLDKKMSFYEMQRGQILQIDIQHMPILIFKFCTAYENGENQRDKRVFDIIKTKAKHKDGIQSVQEFFGGKRISRYKKSIDITKASDYVSYVGEQLLMMTDDSVKPEPVN